MKMRLKIQILNCIPSSLFAFALLWVPFNSGAQETEGFVIDKIVARVDNYIVIESELEAVYQNYIMGGNKPSRDAKCRLLDRLIIDKMMVAKADIDSIVVMEEEVDANTDRRIQMILQSSGNSAEELERVYGTTMENIKLDLRDRVREQMLSGKMAANITNDVTVTPSEVRRFFKKIPNDSLPFYSSEVEIAQIVKTAEVSKEQKAKVINTLSRLRDRILQGESFTKLAREYSEDPSVRQNDGEMGYVGRGAMVANYEAVAFKLKKGQISMPFESPFGFHIMQLIDRRGNEYNSRHILVSPTPSPKDIERTGDFLDSLRTVILEGTLSFVQAAKQFSTDQVTKGQGGFFSTPEGDYKLPVKSIEPSIYFVIDTMAVGDISGPVSYRTPTGKAAVRIIYFKSKYPPHKANLQEDWNKIKAAALAEKKDRTLNEWFDQAKKDVFIKIAPEYNSCNIMKE